MRAIGQEVVFRGITIFVIEIHFTIIRVKTMGEIRLTFRPFSQVGILWVNNFVKIRPHLLKNGHPRVIKEIDDERVEVWEFSKVVSVGTAEMIPDVFFGEGELRERDELLAGGTGNEVIDDEASFGTGERRDREIGRGREEEWEKGGVGKDGEGGEGEGGGKGEMSLEESAGEEG